MTGIIFATEEEARPFLHAYKRGRFEGMSEGETQHDDDVLVSLTGSGKIKATLRSERLLQEYRLDRIVHAGTCTSLTDAVKVGQVVIAAQVFEGDRIELAAPSYPRMPLETPSDDLPHLTLVTQDHTIQPGSEQTYWQRIADVVDMTGYAVAYIAAMHGTPCQIVKVVTGRIAEEDPHLKRTLQSAHHAMGAWLVDYLERLQAGDD